MRTTWLAASSMVLLAGLTGIAGCAVEGEADGEHDAFATDGKSDIGGIADGSPEAAAVLELANTMSMRALDDSIGLDARAARGIADKHNGRDRQPFTADDFQFTTLAELDAVGWVGPVAFGKLLAYARDHGFIEVENCVLGKSLDEMLAADWLDVGPETELTASSDLEPSVVAQIRDGMKQVYEEDGLPSLEWSFEIADGSIWSYKVVERSTDRVYTVYVLNGPSIGYGMIYEGATLTSPVKYDDGDFTDCTALRSE